MKKKKKTKITDQQLLQSSIKELQFANLQVQHLLSVLNELEAFAGTLEKAVIRNGIERHHLDKLIHSRVIFN